MFIIQIGSRTFYKYGCNTRDKRQATIFPSSEKQIAENICQQFKNARLITA